MLTQNISTSLRKPRLDPTAVLEADREAGKTPSEATWRVRRVHDDMEHAGHRFHRLLQAEDGLNHPLHSNRPDIIKGAKNFLLHFKNYVSYNLKNPTGESLKKINDHLLDNLEYFFSILSSLIVFFPFEHLAFRNSSCDFHSNH